MQNILDLFQTKIFLSSLSEKFCLFLFLKKISDKTGCSKTLCDVTKFTKKTSQVIDSSLSQVCVLPSKSVPCLLVGKASILSAVKGCITNSVVFWRSVGFCFTGDLNMGCENTLVKEENQN